MIDFQALHLAKPETSFTSLQRQHIENMAKDLTKHLGTPVNAFFGDTETGEQWADFGISELPRGTWAQPGQLLAIKAGAGDHGGHVVVSRDHQLVGPAAGTLNYEQLMRRVRKEAQAAYREMCKGAIVDKAR